MPALSSNPWARTCDDAVRDGLESAHFAAVVQRLLDRAPGGRVLDLGCGDGLVASIAGPRMTRYLGVDLFPPEGVPSVHGDLREGLGPLAREPFDLYLATFGVASHLAPAELRRLVAEIARCAPRGAVVALEALGLHSLEWPGVWDAPPGPGRTLSYRLRGDVAVHPWSACELGALFQDAGLSFVAALDRTVQAGPKVGPDGHWPGLPSVRAGLAALLAGDDAGRAPLAEPLPPLPAHPAARAHHALAASRRSLVARAAGVDPAALARAVWALEPRGGRGLGHGLLVVGRVL